MAGERLSEIIKGAGYTMAKEESINKLRIFIEQDRNANTVYVECDGAEELFAIQLQNSKDALKEVNKFIARNLSD